MRSTFSLVPPALVLLVALFQGGIPAPARAAASLEQFFGTYVGSAETTEGSDADETGSDRTFVRDLDAVIEPYRGDGFTITLVTVMHAKEGRATPGARRRVLVATFRAADRPGVFLPVAEKSLFSTSRRRDPMEGDEVIWARIEDQTLSVFSLQIGPDGRSYLLSYHRTLTEDGLDILFTRQVDGVLDKRIEGRMVRVKAE